MSEMALSLAGEWRLTSKALSHDIPITIPGDVYSALLAADILPDPFYADNELQWVPYAQYDWRLQREFTLTDKQYRASRIMLDIAVVDTIAEIHINQHKVADTASMFVPLLIDITEYVQGGRGEIAIVLRSAERAAQISAAPLPYPIPHTEHPVQSPHRNLIRKVQCHSGWDWGPALMTAGVYQRINLLLSPEYVVRAHHCDIFRLSDSQWRVQINIEIHSTIEVEIPISASVAGAHTTESFRLHTGEQRITLALEVDNPHLWWPLGHGEQPHYSLTIQVGETQHRMQIAFRTVEVEHTADEYGTSLRFVVNGRPLMITGANWIPCDALPSRQTEAEITTLLESARAAHINMLRVWGGGQYESDFFYRYCSKVGILVWQDFMFSCALYPAQRSFLALVRQEAEAQVKRLKDFPCIALWCGNNENIGALTWFPESRENRDRYLIDYDRLNEGVLGDTVRALDPQRLFWPSSPCGGPNDYRANWHSDSDGDMHFWSVWHEGRAFDAYYSVIPRFCSEFGFQSFSSLRLTRSFAPPEAFNPTHPLFEHHQRHPRGNTIIIETIGRYFRLPQTFENTIYLSQLQQGWAIQTAVEYWRFHAQRCGGMMYWQLNDLWPGASWSSIEYGGGWKLFHYLVRRFYAPLHIAAFRDPATDEVVCALYNNHPRARSVSISLVWYRSDGSSIHSQECDMEVRQQSTARITLDERARDISGEVILVMRLFTRDEERENKGRESKERESAENIFLYSPPKRYSLPLPTITVTDITPLPDASPPACFPHADSTYALSLASSDIAVYVALAVQEQFGGLSDNLLFLHPNHPRTLRCYVDSTAITDADQLRQQIKCFDLAHSSAPAAAPADA